MLRSFAKGTRRKKRERERERETVLTVERRKVKRRNREKRRQIERKRGMGRRKMLGVGKTGERTEDIELKWPLGAHSSIPLSLP